MDITLPRDSPRYRSGNRNGEGAHTRNAFPSRRMSLIQPPYSFAFSAPMGVGRETSIEWGFEPYRVEVSLVEADISCMEDGSACCLEDLDLVIYPDRGRASTGRLKNEWTSGKVMKRHFLTAWWNDEHSTPLTPHPSLSVALCGGMIHPRPGSLYTL